MKDKYSSHKYYQKYLVRMKIVEKMTSSDLSILAKNKFLKEYYAKFPIDMIYNKQLFIKTKASLIRLDPRDRVAQMDFLEIVQEHVEANKPLLILIPKARRQGISTIVEAVIYVFTSQRENLNATIIADEKKNSANIFEMTKLFHEKSSPIVKPPTKKSNAIELHFEETHSLINIDTANKVEIGRSWEYMFIHLSELAFFGKNAAKIMLGIIQTVPKDMFTMVALESTGNGIGDYFHTKVVEALAGDSDFEVFFIPWFMHPDYISELEDGEIITYFKDHARYGREIEVVAFLAKNGVTNIPERMKWRRWSIRNNCDNKLKQFKQEYPQDVNECFQSSGVSKWDHDEVTDFMKLCIPPNFRGDFDEAGHFSSTPNGKVDIWDMPIQGWEYRYCIGIDTGGTWFDSETNCADYTHMTVYDRVMRCDVARVRGHFEPKLAVSIACSLGVFYNTAMIVPEINKWVSETDDSGLVIVDYLRDLYPNLYLREVLDQFTKVLTKKVGFHTNKATRPLLLDYITEMLNDYRETGEYVNDILVCNEMQTFVRNDRLGKFEHAEGKKDDALFSQAIARYVAQSMPEPILLSTLREDIYEETDSDIMGIFG